MYELSRVRLYSMPSLPIALFESAQMEKNFRRVFEPAMAKQPPQSDQIAHQAAHDPRTHRALFLRPRPAAGQHVGFLIVLGDELDFHFAGD